MHIQRLYWDSQSRRTFVHNVGVEPTLKRYNPELPFWQNVKRSPPQCPSSHQNTVWWIPRPFSGDSQNTYGCRFHPFRFTTNSTAGSVASFFYRTSGLTCPFNTFRFVDTAHLLENETPIFFLSSPDHLTFAGQTILFEKWNYIVWLVKHLCFARETILFEPQNVSISKMKCIVF